MTTLFDNESFGTSADEAMEASQKAVKDAFNKAAFAVRSFVVKTGNADMDDAEKISRLNTIADNAGFLASSLRRDEQPPAAEVGASSGTKSPRSGDEDNDKAEDLRKATAAKRVAEANADKLRRAIEKITGTSLTFGNDDRVTSDVDALLKDALNAAKQAGKDEVQNATPQDVNDLKAKIKPILQKIDTAHKTGKKPAMGGANDRVFKGPEIAKIDGGLNEIDSLIS